MKREGTIVPLAARYITQLHARQLHLDISCQKPCYSQTVINVIRGSLPRLHYVNGALVMGNIDGKDVGLARRVTVQ